MYPLTNVQQLKNIYIYIPRLSCCLMALIHKHWTYNKSHSLRSQWGGLYSRKLTLDKCKQNTDWVLFLKFSNRFGGSPGLVVMGGDSRLKVVGSNPIAISLL